jgi:hypothetical protein
MTRGWSECMKRDEERNEEHGWDEDVERRRMCIKKRLEYCIVVRDLGIVEEDCG